MFKFLVLTLPILYQAFASEIDPATDFYSHIRNIYAPSQEELNTLQYKMLHTYRPILNRMPETGHILKEFRFLGNHPQEEAQYQKLLCHCSDQNKEKCIITFSSFNHRYPLGVKRLVQSIVESDYQGHIHYRIGGWPNIANGDIRLLHVPFAFKPCFFKEMQLLGYKKVLWLDSSVLPAPGISLNLIFQMIERIGFFIQANDHTIEKYMNEDSAQAFGISMEDTKNIMSCSAAIIGFDLTNRRTCDLLDAWYAAAHHPFAFFSDRSDQNALSILIHKMHLTGDLIPRKLLGSLSNPHGNLFIMDRNLVKNN